VKREAVKEQSPPRRSNHWLLALGAAGAIALAARVWFISFHQSPSATQPRPQTSSTAQGQRFSPGQPVTRTDLETLQWEEVNPLLQSVGADPAEIRRLVQLAGEVASPAATYLSALLLILQREPDRASAAFASLDLQAIPPPLLYAPHRLQRSLHPDSPDPYLDPLRTAVAEGKVPALIQARVQAEEGDLGTALSNYLRTDPGSWTNYDLESLQRIGMHEGLSADLRRAVAGALGSGRVQPTLVAPLQEVARNAATAPGAEEFKRQLRREIEAKTPAGQVAIESVKRLIKDRNMFVGRKYAEFIDAHREAEPIKLATETVLLLFLSAVELKEQIEMDRWGQELKRRHGDAEVRDWVNEMTGSAQ
jgi:hypothetical protein